MNRNLFLVLTLFIVTGCALRVSTGVTPNTTTETPDPNQLIGSWEVDLRPKPGAEPYFQEFIVSEINGKTFSGTFYGTPVTQGRINKDWGAVRIAFVTADQSGPYNHSAILSGDKLEGLSNSTGRDFLSYWSAQKKPSTE